MEDKKPKQVTQYVEYPNLAHPQEGIPKLPHPNQHWGEPKHKRTLRLTDVAFQWLQQQGQGKGASHPIEVWARQAKVSNKSQNTTQNTKG